MPGLLPRFRVPWQVQYLMLTLIWGSSFLLLKVGDEGFNPLQLTFVRTILGAVVLVAILALRRDRLPRGVRIWGHLAVVGLLLNVLPYTLFAYGETHITSVLAGIWNATAPLFTVLVVMFMLPDDRPTIGQIAGILTGFAGVLVVLGFWQGLAGGTLLGSLACLIGAGTEALGFPYADKYLAGRAPSVLSLAAAQMICCVVEVAPLIPFFGGLPTSPGSHAVAALLVMGLFNTGIAYILSYGLVRDVGATVTSTVLYVLPLVATLEGVLLLREPLTWNEPIGGAVVILGVAMSQGRLLRLPRQPSGSAETTRVV